MSRDRYYDPEVILQVLRRKWRSYSLRNPVLGQTHQIRFEGRGNYRLELGNGGYLMASEAQVELMLEGRGHWELEPRHA